MINFEKTEKELKSIENVYNNNGTVIKSTLEAALSKMQEILNDKEEFIKGACNTNYTSEKAETISKLEGLAFPNLNLDIENLKKIDENINDLEEKKGKLLDSISKFKELHKPSLCTENAYIYTIHIRNLSNKEGEKFSTGMIKGKELPDSYVIVDDSEILAIKIKETQYPSLFEKRYHRKNCFLEGVIEINSDKESGYNKGENKEQDKEQIFFQITPMLELGSLEVRLDYLQKEEESIFFISDNRVRNGRGEFTCYK